LLLIRLSYASLSFSAFGAMRLAPVASWVAAGGAGVVGVALATGLATRWAALLLTICLTAAAFAATIEVALLLLPNAGGAAALAILGPGAYSIDAHLFGRRVIHLDPRRSGRRGDS
jgi:putative oxidoreductase